MNAHQAYSILSKKYPLCRVMSCLDFGSFFAFDLRRISIPADEMLYTGPYLKAVNKKTGKIYEYNILLDPDAYLNAKPIEVHDIMDTKILEARLG